MISARRTRRQRRRGQSLVEFALAMPFLLVLLVGGAQVAAIAYSMVSTDTIAREAGAVGQLNPASGLDPVQSSPGETYTCTGSSDTNPICKAAYSSVGLLSTSQMTVTIKMRGSSLLSRYAPPDDVILTSNGNNCPSNAQVTGTISGLPSGAIATVSSSTDGASTSSTSTGTYSLCTAAGTGTISATYTAGSCTYSGVSGTNSWTKNNSTEVDFSVNPSCATTTTSTSSGGSSTSTSTNTTGTVTQTTTTVGTFSCSQTVTYPAFFTVTVTYHTGIFVPLVGTIFADSGKSYRTVTSTVDEEIAPCGVTNGN